MQKHTDYVTTELDSSLNSLRESVKNENKDEANAQYEEIVKQWEKDKKSFNMYIEHAEIEKVEMYLVEIKSHLETEEYAMAIESIDMCDFMI